MPAVDDHRSRVRAAWLTAAAMVAFASNSILCRMALRGGHIDPAAFTAVRLTAGALVLSPLALRGRGVAGPPVWPLALSLFAYASAFSFAYVRLDAATGALILFGAVQLTMVVGGYLQGQRPSARQLQGFGLSVVGLLMLTLPGVGSVEPFAALAMGVAGVAWGVYSVRGRSSQDARIQTARNFLWTLPAVALLLLASRDSLHATATGLGLAVASGALASALGYVLWYGALPHLLAVEAALVQLSVPVITALAGALLLGESLAVQTLASGAAILFGIAWAVSASRPRP